MQKLSLFIFALAIVMGPFFSAKAVDHPEIRFYNVVAKFEATIKLNTSSPQKMHADIEQFKTQYEEVRLVLEDKSPSLVRRSELALQKAYKKLETPNAFKNVSEEEIHAALAGLPKDPVFPLPARFGDAPMSQQFYCLMALRQSGASSQFVMEKDQVIYDIDPQAVYLRTYDERGKATFILTLDGVHYLPDAEAEQRQCVGKIGDQRFLAVDLKKGKGFVGKNLILSASLLKFPILKDAAINTDDRGQYKCEVNPTIPGEGFSILHNVAGRMANEIADAYVKSLEDLPRQWVLKQNGSTLVHQPNDANILNAIKTCRSPGVSGFQIERAINKILATRQTQPGDEDRVAL